MIPMMPMMPTFMDVQMYQQLRDQQQEQDCALALTSPPSLQPELQTAILSHQDHSRNKQRDGTTASLRSPTQITPRTRLRAKQLCYTPKLPSNGLLT